MTYPGGKNGAGVYQTIINLMPPHEVYIEPFLGGGAVLWQKRAAGLNIGIDLDAQVIHQWQARTVISSDTAGGIAGNGEGKFVFRVGDGIAFLQSYPFTGRELVYCDPPYVHDTRRRTDLYRFEMTDDQHAALLDALKALPCMVMVSGYWSSLYADALQGWSSTSFQAMTRGGRLATEWLWCNYPAPVALHDYGYLGEDFRERERIKRKKQRWVKRLQSMPTLEQRALLAAIEEAWPPRSSPATAMPARALSPNITIPADIVTPDDAGSGTVKNSDAPGRVGIGGDAQAVS